MLFKSFTIEHASQYVEFNVEELQQVACNAVGAQGCTQFLKLNEGIYNKIFAMNFDNRSEAITKIPTKLAGPPFLTAASEAATLEFAREVLGIPTPHVFAWNSCSDLDRNPIGAKYIITEKVSGVGLQHQWRAISGKDALTTLSNMWKIEKSFKSALFASIGSLYFKEDVSLDLQAAPLFAQDCLMQNNSDMLQKLSLASKKYQIGPITNCQWWHGKRLGMTADRGPFIPHIVPPTGLCTPTLWHLNLSLSNIHVTESGLAHIIGIINWQGAAITLYYMQAPLFPLAFSYKGDQMMVLPGPFIPQLPEDFSTLPPEDRE